MSFQTAISALMLADSSLNTLVNGGIYFDILPVNFDLKKDWIVFNYAEKERIDVLGTKNIMTYYSFYVKAISPSTTSLLSISDEANTYLTNYKNTNFLNISYVTDNHSNSIVDEQDIFENTIEYNIAYKI